MIKLTSFFALVFVVLLAGCSKEKGEEESKYPYYFTATIGGKAVKYEANLVDSRFLNGTTAPSMSVGYDQHDIYEGTQFRDEQDFTRNYVAVLILKHFNDEPTTEQRIAMFHTGAYGYGKADVSDATIDGASILYTDNEGVEWSSEWGPQQGSTFTITELSNNDNGLTRKILAARFHCMLYDEEGHSQELVDGEVRGMILTY